MPAVSLIPSSASSWRLDLEKNSGLSKYSPSQNCQVFWGWDCNCLWSSERWQIPVAGTTWEGFGRRLGFISTHLDKQRQGKGVLDRETEQTWAEGACSEAPGLWMSSPHCPGGPHQWVNPGAWLRDSVRVQEHHSSSESWTRGTLFRAHIVWQLIPPDRQSPSHPVCARASPRSLWSSKRCLLTPDSTQSYHGSGEGIKGYASFHLYPQRAHSPVRDGSQANTPDVRV